jgi:hypothetical protein
MQWRNDPRQVQGQQFRRAGIAFTREGVELDVQAEERSARSAENEPQLSISEVAEKKKADK